MIIDRNRLMSIPLWPRLLLSGPGSRVAIFGTLLRSRRPHLIRRVRGCDSAGLRRPRALRSLRGAAGRPCHFRCPKPCNFQCPKPCNFRCPLTVLSIRRIRGWVGAEPIRPRAAARGYTRTQLRSSIRMACKGHLTGQPTPTAASQLSSNPQHCKEEHAFLLE